VRVSPGAVPKETRLAEAFRVNREEPAAPPQTESRIEKTPPTVPPDSGAPPASSTASAGATAEETKVPVTEAAALAPATATTPATIPEPANPPTAHAALPEPAGTSQPNGAMARSAPDEPKRSEAATNAAPYISRQIISFSANDSQTQIVNLGPGTTGEAPSSSSSREARTVGAPAQAPGSGAPAPSRQGREPAPVSQPGRRESQAAPRSYAKAEPPAHDRRNQNETARSESGQRRTLARVITPSQPSRSSTANLDQQLRELEMNVASVVVVRRNSELFGRVEALEAQYAKANRLSEMTKRRFDLLRFNLARKVLGPRSEPQPVEPFLPPIMGR
jgi:hypothetical protein